MPTLEESQNLVDRIESDFIEEAVTVARRLVAGTPQKLNLTPDYKLFLRERLAEAKSPQDAAEGLVRNFGIERTQMTDAEKRLYDLDLEKDGHVQFFKDLDAAAEAVALENGIDHHFQHPSSKDVFKLDKPEGTFMYYKDVHYGRTRRDGEAKGSLAATAASALGYELSDAAQPKKKGA